MNIPFSPPRQTLTAYTKSFACLATFLLSCLVSTHTLAVKLPELGSINNHAGAKAQEKKLGQYWMRSFRRQAPISNDALIYDYTENLIQQLAFNSELQEKQIHLLLIDNKSFNAFAVPGNVIGVNLGLFYYADTEDELASVLAHEIAHISQSHYARTVQQQKEQQWKNILGILGSLVVMSQVGGEEGLAALSATQAAAISARLKYSRQHEQEADRIGIHTLAQAGYNPQAAASMFEKLLVNTRYRKNLKQFDFLLTHPLTEARVSDAFNQASRYPARPSRNSLSFNLIKNHLIANQLPPKKSLDFYESRAALHRLSPSEIYGQATAELRNNNTQKAILLSQALLEANPHNIAFILLHANILSAQQSFKAAQKLLIQSLAITPESYPLTKAIAELALKQRKPDIGITPLRQYAKVKKERTGADIWYLLAELEGLNGNIIDVHTSRAEYFYAMGDYKESIKYLNLAIKEIEASTSDKTKLGITQLRLEQMEAIMKDNPLI